MAPRTSEQIIELYTPRMPAQQWEAIAPFVRDVVRCGFIPSQIAKVTATRISEVASIVAWAREQGLPLDVEEVFHPATVNRYAMTAPGLAAASRSTRRATLTTLSRRITRRAPWEPQREALRYPRTVAPYTAAQVAQLLWWAPRQASAVRRRGLAAAVALGVGAGLRGTEMLNVGVPDVQVRGEHVIIEVRGAKRRDVPVRPAYREAVLASAERASRGHLFRDPVPRVEFVSDLLAQCEAPRGVKPVTSSRLRLTWEVAMVQAVPLPIFMRLSGLTATCKLNNLLALDTQGTRARWSIAELDAIAEAVPW